MPLDLDDPTAVALAIFRALSDRAIETALYVLFKVLSTRERDLEDAVTVHRSPDLTLDRSLIEGEAARLAVEIPDHDITTRLARVRLRLLPGP